MATTHTSAIVGTRARLKAMIATAGTQPFRLFFLLAALDAIAGVAVWLAPPLGVDPYGFAPAGLAVFHREELLSGAAPAVFAGVILTALPRWTRRPPFLPSSCTHLPLPGSRAASCTCSHRSSRHRRQRSSLAASPWRLLRRLSRPKTAATVKLSCSWPSWRQAPSLRELSRPRRRASLERA